MQIDTLPRFRQSFIFIGQNHNNGWKYLEREQFYFHERTHCYAPASFAKLERASWDFEVDTKNTAREDWVGIV